MKYFDLMGNLLLNIGWLPDFVTEYGQTELGTV